GNSQILSLIRDREQFVLFQGRRWRGDYRSPGRSSRLRAQTRNLWQNNRGHRCWWKCNTRRHKKIPRAQSRHNAAALPGGSCPMKTQPVLISMKKINVVCDRDATSAAAFLVERAPLAGTYRRFSYTRG